MQHDMTSIGHTKPECNVLNLPSQTNPPPLLTAFKLEQLIGLGPRTDTIIFV